MKKDLLKYKNYCEKNPFSRYMSTLRFTHIYDRILDNIENQLEICSDFREDLPYLINYFDNKNYKKAFIINYIKPIYQCADIWKISTEYIEDPILTLLATKKLHKVHLLWNTFIPRLIIDTDDHYQLNNFIIVVNFCKTFNFNNQKFNNIVDFILKCIINSAEQNNFIQKCLNFIYLKYQQNNSNNNWLNAYLKYLLSNKFKKNFKEKIENTNISLQEQTELFYEMSFSLLNLFTDMFNKFETFLAINKKNKNELWII